MFFLYDDTFNVLTPDGIKLFDGAGYKWRPEDEQRLEQELPGPVEEQPRDATLPLLAPESDLADSYLEALADSLPAPRPLDGLRIALDCANGAAAPFAPPLFGRPGGRAEVILAAPENAVAPGQACVFYDGDRVLGGGWITRDRDSLSAAA